MTETIYGVIVSKSNHYMSVPDGATGSRIILDDVFKKYQSSFLAQISIYKDKMINSPFMQMFIISMIGSTLIIQ